MARVTIRHRCGHEVEHKIPFSATSKRGRACREQMAGEMCDECIERTLSAKPARSTDWADEGGWDDDSPEQGSPATD